MLVTVSRNWWTLSTNKKSEPVEMIQKWMEVSGDHEYCRSVGYNKSIFNLLFLFQNGLYLIKCAPYNVI